MGVTSHKRIAVLAVLVLAIYAFAGSGCSWIIPSQTAQGQGWTDTERNWFYYTTQGSRLIRRDWFLNLEVERDDSQDLFLADGLKRFGYIPGELGQFNPDRLPVGFAVDRRTQPEWIGPTCAACHTSEINFGASVIRIEGGPAAADLYQFLASLDLALRKAANNDAAFGRFAPKVLGTSDSPAGRTALRKDLQAFSGEFKKFVEQSTPTAPLKWGPARADAFGMIFNRVSVIDLGIDSNNQPPNAPVSYPFLWGTSWHDFTQWNGAVPNGGGTLLGPLKRLARNVGQVLGVFGTLDLTTEPPYDSSARRRNLLDLEVAVSKLVAPAWPQAFGVPDPVKVSRGKDLYVAKGCVNCHALVAKDQQNQPAQVQVVRSDRIGTDDAMTRMAASRTAATGRLQGRLKDPLNPQEGTIGASMKVSDMLSHAVIGAILHGVFQSSGASATSTPPEQPQPMFDAVRLNEMNYKARPLNGIWATAPYLHNGSVRTLYQMLLPSSAARARQLGLDPTKVRDAKFRVGSREFDPVDVGFKNAPGVIDFELDTTLPGNSNAGHESGIGMTDEERRDLVEYLKTL